MDYNIQRQQQRSDTCFPSFTLTLWSKIVLYTYGHVPASLIHDVPDRFWSSIAYPRRKHIWTTTSNVNNNAPTLASHHSLDFMVKNCTLYLWTCTGHVISHDVPDRFWSSIAYPRRKHIWSTTSNVNNNAPTLASHHSPWLYGQKLYFILMDMYWPCDISWCTRPFLIINSLSKA